MREILFRGKSIETEKWLYGNIQVPNPPFDKYFMHDEIHRQHEVYKDSVGQFTGLKDKNNEKIFEGDVVEFTINAGLSSEFKSNWVIYYGSWCMMRKNSFENSFAFDTIDAQNSFIIGNIYDNPLLLDFNLTKE